VIWIDFIQAPIPETSVRNLIWDDCLKEESKGLIFEQMDFNDPIWILYSSGTTGLPKAITHSHGGMLLEHLKYLVFAERCQSRVSAFFGIPLLDG
jgi:acetoacetyl-CoA synthetase